MRRSAPCTVILWALFSTFRRGPVLIWPSPSASSLATWCRLVATPHALSAFSAPPPDYGNYPSARPPAEYETVGVVLENGNRYQLLDAGLPPPGTMYLTPEHEPEAGADWRD